MITKKQITVLSNLFRFTALVLLVVLLIVK